MHTRKKLLILCNNYGTQQKGSNNMKKLTLVQAIQITFCKQFKLHYK